MHISFRALNCAASAVVATLVCAPLAHAGPAEDYFLHELYKTQQKWYWPYGESYIIGVAHQVCDAWQAGVGYPDKVGSLSADKGWTGTSTRYFIALSTATFCPERYATVIPPEARLPDGM